MVGNDAILNAVHGNERNKTHQSFGVIATTGKPFASEKKILFQQKKKKTSGDHSREDKGRASGREGRHNSKTETKGYWECKYGPHEPRVKNQEGGTKDGF